MSDKVRSAVVCMFAIVMVMVEFAPAFPCSTFVLKQENVLLFGKNWDFYTGRGMIVINKRGIEKSSLVMPPENPTKWVSRYGSITFNQLGREFPYGGMNEKGLVIEIMWLDESVYPAQDERPALNEVQWIQYQLDNCGTVEEVIESMKHVRIGQNWSKIHYMVCDRSGNAATIEFVDGESVIHSGGSLPVTALTNSTYDDCVQLLRAYDGFTLEEKVQHSSLASADRFLKIARRIEDFRSMEIGPAIDYAFDILTSVGVGTFFGQRTCWSIVYDVESMKIYFKTFENRNIRIIDANAFDFSNGSESWILDVSADVKDDVTGSFIEYSPDINKALILEVFEIYRREGFLTELPEFAGYYLAGYPETSTRPVADR